jgi:peptide/nickel transport system substrate-binding protein
MSRNWKAFIISLTAVVSAVFFFSSGAVAKEKTLRMRVAYSVQNFDPGRYTLHETSVILRSVYDNLLDYKPGAWPEMENQLATNYDITANGLEYTFTLKKGVQWQKGFGEVTSEDVRFSIERVMDPANKAPMRSVWTAVIDRIETPSRYTVKFFLKHPDPAFLAKLAPWRPGPIVSKKAVQKFGKEYGMTPETTVGCGPFELVEYVPKQKVVLKRYEGYHGTAAKLDKIEIFVMADEGTAVLSLQKGELDMCYLRQPDNIPLVRKDRSLNLYQGSSATTKGFIAFNLENPILKDVRVRRAMVHALDRDLISETVGGEMATRACGFLAPGAYLGALDCDELRTYPYDPEKAKALLAEAGYAKGFTIRYSEINVKAHRDIAPALQAYWSEVGIKTKIDLLPVKEWIGRGHKGNFDVIKYSMGTRPSEPSLFLHSNFHSSSTRPGLNFMAYKGMDNLLEEALATTNENIRIAIYGVIQRKIIDESLLIPIYYESLSMATSKRVDLGRGAKGKMLTNPYWFFYWLEDIDIR